MEFGNMENLEEGITYYCRHSDALSLRPPASGHPDRSSLAVADKVGVY